MTEQPNSTALPFPYRLVRVEHSRCGEYDGTEYVLAPIEWDGEKIDGEVSAVVKEMIADAKLVKDAPLTPPHHPPYADHPDKTVAEIQAAHEERKIAYKQWLEENRHLTRSFQERLREHGFVRLWDDEPATGRHDASTYWGHSHGLKLNYEQASY